MDPAKERELIHEHGRQTGNSGSGLFFDKNRIETTAVRDATEVNEPAETKGTSGGLGALFGRSSDKHDKNATTTSSKDKENRNYGALGSHKEQDTTSSEHHAKENASSDYSGKTSGQTGYTRSSDLADTHRSGITDSIATTGVSTGAHKMSGTSGKSSKESGLSNMSSRNEHATTNIGSSSSGHYDSSQHHDAGAMNQGQEHNRDKQVHKEELIYRATTEEENAEDKRKANTGAGSSNFSGNTSSRS